MAGRRASSLVPRCHRIQIALSLEIGLHKRFMLPRKAPGPEHSRYSFARLILLLATACREGKKQADETE